MEKGHLETQYSGVSPDYQSKTLQGIETTAVISKREAVLPVSFYTPAKNVELTEVERDYLTDSTVSIARANTGGQACRSPGSRFELMYYPSEQAQAEVRVVLKISAW